MRPRRIWAVARRDLARELKGRRGWVLPAVIAGLMLPVSGAPSWAPSPAQLTEIRVAGDVPERVLAAPAVTQDEDSATLLFRQTSTGLEVSGGPIPPRVRRALDGDNPAVRRVHVPRSMPLPDRSLLLALLSASTLTGAVSSSIGGERQARTLVSLLVAGLTRAEVVLGKFLAWGGFGAATSLAAASVAVALGRLDAGWWMLPLVTVAPGAVALGLWLVRRATDVIGGTLVSLRVIPAVVATTGIAAWFIGLEHPLLGAALPIGGALCAAGSTWGADPAPALLSALSTGAFSLALLQSTWRALDESVGRSGLPSATAVALRTAALGTLAWWAPVLGPVLWHAAGNPVLYETLPTWPGVLAGALCLGALAVVSAARGVQATAPAGPAPSKGVWILAIATGAVLAWWPNTVLPWTGTAELAAGRAADGLHPIAAGPVICALALVADEWLFRGWLQRRVGPVRAVMVWTWVKTPHDPIGGLILGSAMAGLASRGSWVASAAARVSLSLILYLAL